MKKYRKEIDYYFYNYIQFASSNKAEEKKWFQIIKDIKSKYEGTPYGELIRLKYDLKQKETTICYILHIESTTYYAWVNKIINEATLRAAYERLIIPF